MQGFVGGNGAAARAGAGELSGAGLASRVGELSGVGLESRIGELSGLIGVDAPVVGVIGVLGAVRGVRDASGIGDEAELVVGDMLFMRVSIASVMMGSCTFPLH